MVIFGIHIETRSEKQETLKKIIESLSISEEEKDIYIISIEILDDRDFDAFFQKIVSQIHNGFSTKEYSIEPMTSTII